MAGQSLSDEIDDWRYDHGVAPAMRAKTRPSWPTAMTCCMNEATSSLTRAARDEVRAMAVALSSYIRAQSVLA